MQIAAYEREINALREELLKVIGHLEERKEEAVKAAANCSEENLQNLQDQFISEYQPTFILAAQQSISEYQTTFILPAQQSMPGITPNGLKRLI